MKLLLFVVFVGLALAKPTTDGRGCIYIDGRCHSYLPQDLMRTLVVPIVKNGTGDIADKGAEACPVGTHEYAVGCDYITPEATCSNPTPVLDTLGMICDYSACYCDAPTVRDEKTGRCVSLDKCTNKSKTKPIVT